MEASVAERLCWDADHSGKAAGGTVASRWQHRPEHWLPPWPQHQRDLNFLPFLSHPAWLDPVYENPTQRLALGFIPR